MRAIMDTSSILFALRHRKDIFAAVGKEFPSLQVVVSRGIVAELKGIGLNRGKKGAAARLALAMLKVKNVSVYNSGMDPDRWILREASHRYSRIIITNDTLLAQKVSLLGARCFKVSVSGRLKRYLQF